MTPAAGVPSPYVVDAVYCGAPGPGDMAKVRVLRLVVWGASCTMADATDSHAAQIAQARKWEYVLGILGFLGVLAETGEQKAGFRVYGWRQWGGEDGKREWGWFRLDVAAEKFTYLLREGLAVDFFGPGVEYAPARELWGDGEGTKWRWQWVKK